MNIHFYSGSLSAPSHCLHANVKLNTIQSKVTRAFREMGKISVEKRRAIVHKWCSIPGLSLRKLAKLENVGVKAVRIAIRKFGEEYSLEDLPRSGRKKGAICSCGKFTKPYIVNGVMNADIYVNQCLKKYLLPLIRQHDTPVIFWPDLASCHYAKLTMDWYTSKNVIIVPKHMNPPNCPEIRPIEQFWALVKRYLRTQVQPADTVEKFKRDWTKASKIVANQSAQNLMKNVRGKVRKLAYE